MNNNTKLGLRTGPVDHSFNLPYSLELFLEFGEKSLLGIFTSFPWYLISGYLDICISGMKECLSSAYLILGTWYREPFCHQMGPYQTLRAGNWWTQLLVTFRVFFKFRKSRNHLNEVQNSRDVLFWEKKGPCQECPGTRPNGFLQKSMDFQGLDQTIYPIPKMIRPKMMPWSTSIHWNATNPLFY